MRGSGAAGVGNYEEGRWRLNDPVSRYIPELAGLQVYAGEDADGSMPARGPPATR